MDDYNQQQGYNPNQQYIPNQPYPQQPPPQQQFQGSVQWPPMRLGEWLITRLLLLIPFVNIVLIFIWAFGSNVNPSKKSYFQAELIWAAISIVLMIVLLIALGSVIYSLFSGALESFYYF